MKLLLRSLETEGIMPAKTTALAEALEKDNPDCQDNSAAGIILEADYAEDRPVALLAERQREFQKILRDHYVDAEMPPA